MPVHTMFTSVPEQTRFESAKPCLAGQYWVWDGVRFEILHPSDTVEFNGNNASCVLKIGTGRSSVLLTGDIESRAEARILDKIPAKLPSMVMVAPHHGSKTSSGHRFIHAVSPETVIFSSGYLNRFRLPNQDIIDRYRTSGAETFNTATDGAVTIRFRNGKISVSGERERASRFWNFKA
jgi:competence protein ComEC